MRYWEIVLASSLPLNWLLPALNVRKPGWRWDLPLYWVFKLSVAEDQENWRDYDLQAARDLKLCQSTLPRARRTRSNVSQRARRLRACAVKRWRNREHRLGVVTTTEDDENERDIEAGPPVPSPTDSDCIQLV